MSGPIAIGMFVVSIVGACYLIAQAVVIADAMTVDDADFGDWPHVPRED